MILPILQYASGIWGVDEYSPINSVFFRTCRSYLGVGKYTLNNAVLGEMGWDPPFYHQIQSVVRL